MFVLASPIRKSWWEDTGRTAAVPIGGPVCSPSRSNILGTNEDEYVGRNGKVYRRVAGPVSGVHLSVIHATQEC